MSLRYLAAGPARGPLRKGPLSLDLAPYPCVIFPFCPFRSRRPAVWRAPLDACVSRSEAERPQASSGGSLSGPSARRERHACRSITSIQTVAPFRYLIETFKDFIANERAGEEYENDCAYVKPCPVRLKTVCHVVIYAPNCDKSVRLSDRNRQLRKRASCACFSVYLCVSLCFYVFDVGFVDGKARIPIGYGTGEFPSA